MTPSPGPLFDLPRDVLPRPPRRTDHAIGVVGAGFIVRDVQLVAYREAGFRVAAIASRTPAHARAAAAARGVPTVHDTVAELLADPGIEIVDIAVPPRVQLDVV
ncbi:MAG: Gfo/Idh/MocA family oxidoreductase, partial [Trueperaceae bacterium]|nr:Gfo/Idh/MocA family oxidoreductase [Trueperaceae bacterium]